MTIIGNGMIAKAFAKHPHQPHDVCIFASGVSNSRETNPLAFEREKELLIHTLNTHPDKLFIYFSSCAVTEESAVAYTLHKLELESIIQSSGNRYIIFRLPQVVGLTHNTTLVSYFVHKIINREVFEIYTKPRTLIDIDDVILLTHQAIAIPGLHNRIITLSHAYSVPPLIIVKEIEQLLEVEGIYTVTELDNPHLMVTLDFSECEQLAREISLVFDSEYPHRVLRKYVPQLKFDNSD